MNNTSPDFTKLAYDDIAVPATPAVSVVLAGLPADKAAQDAFTAAGFDLFIHLRAPVEETLAGLLKNIGAL